MEKPYRLMHGVAPIGLMEHSAGGWADVAPAISHDKLARALSANYGVRPAQAASATVAMHTGCAPESSPLDTLPAVFAVLAGYLFLAH